MKIDYSDIDMAFTFVSFGSIYDHSAYLNTRNGNIYYISEFEEPEEEIPEDIYESDDYIAIPHKNDLNLGRDLVFDFVSNRLPEDFEKVQIYFMRKGAYSRFKDLLERRSMLDEWHKFEEERTEKALRKWCKINNIKLTS